MRKSEESQKFLTAKKFLTTVNDTLQSLELKAKVTVDAYNLAMTEIDKLKSIAEESSSTIDSCENYGSISATSTGIGGILGIYYNAATGTGTVTIKNCVNNGSVNGTWGVGGIAGDTLGEVVGCVNNGYISAKGEVAGIVGKCYGKVTECTNNGEIVGSQAIVGGIIGHLHVSTYLDIINTTNYQNGTVTGPNADEIIGTIA